jgi:cytoskeletal protein CcmA (bactofilin family)
MFRTGKPGKEEQSSTTPSAPPPTISVQPEPPAPARQPAPVAEPPAVSKAVNESDSLARNIQNGSLSGFVGAGSQVSGELHFKAMLRVDGHVSGQISSVGGTLIVGSSGQVDANIEVSTARVNGTVNGDIIATESIELGRTAKVFGNIQTPGLVIEQGAIFEGSCRMPQDDNVSRGSSGSNGHSFADV